MLACVGWTPINEHLLCTRIKHSFGIRQSSLPVSQSGKSAGMAVLMSAYLNESLFAMDNITGKKSVSRNNSPDRTARLNTALILP